MEPAVIAFVLLGVMTLLVLLVTATWLLGGFDGTAAGNVRHARMREIRDIALRDASARGHDMVGPSTDVWIYRCGVPECLGTVGVVLGDRARPKAAGTALAHACPTLVETPWDAPTHERHGGPAHDH